MPSDLKTVKSPTNTAWLLVRVFSKGKDDEEAMKILNQFKLTSLDEESSPHVVKPANELLLNNKVEDLNAMDFFKIMTDLMILNPTTGNESFEKQFEYIGINRTYGFDAGKLHPDIIAGLYRGAKDGFETIKNSLEEIDHRNSNGWVTYTGMGAYGDQFLKEPLLLIWGLEQI